MSKKLDGLPLASLRGTGLEADENGPGVDRLAGLTLDRGHAGVGLRLYFVLHLHRLQNEERLSRRDEITRRNPDFDDATGDARPYLRRRGAGPRGFSGELPQRVGEGNVQPQSLHPDLGATAEWKGRAPRDL